MAHSSADIVKSKQDTSVDIGAKQQTNVEAMTQTEQSEQPQERPKQAHAVVRHSVLAIRLTWAAVALVTTFGLGLLVIGLIALMGRSIALPDWAVVRIEDQINAQLGEERVELDAVAIGLRDSAYRPTIDLTGVTVIDGQGDRFLRLPNLRTKLDTSELVFGRFAPETLEIEKATLRLTRDEGGQIAVAFATDLPDMGASDTSLGDVVSQLDEVFKDPLLRELENISAEDLRLEIDDRRTGRLIVVENGIVQLTNGADQIAASVTFGLVMDDGASSNLRFAGTKRKGVDEAEFVAKFTNVETADLASQVAALNWLSILDAPVSGALSTTVDGSGTLSRLAGTLNIGQGVLRPAEQAKPLTLNSAKAYLRYEASKERLVFDELRIDTPDLRLTGGGHADLMDLAGGVPQTLLGQLKFNDIRLDPEGVFDAPVRFETAMLDLRYRPEDLRMEIGRLVLQEGDTRIHSSGEVRVDQDGWNASLDAQLDRVEVRDLLQLWPGSAVPKTRSWLTDNVISGDVIGAEAALRVIPNEPFRAAVTFDFERAKVRYLKTLPPIENARGYLSIFEGAMHLGLHEGTVTAPQGGEISAAGSRMVIPEMDADPAVTQIDLALTAPITAALSLLDEKPFEFLTKSDLSTDFASGTTQISAQLALPLIKDLLLNQIDYAVSANLQDFRSETLIDDHVLQSETLELTAGDGLLEIEGEGQLSDLPIDVLWSRPIGKGSSDKSTITGQIELSPRTLETFNIGLPPGSVSGTGTANVTIALDKGAPPQAVITSNLRGIGMGIDALGWRKPRDADGDLRVAMQLGEEPIIEGISLKTAGLDTVGAISLRPGGGLERAVFSPLRIAGRFNSRVEVIGQGSGVPVRLAITGGTIDIRKFGVTERSSGGARPPMDLKLDRVILTDGIALDGFRGRFKNDRGLDGTFSARVNGGAAIQGRLTPTAEGLAATIASENGGAVLKSAGVFENANGGEMLLTLRPNGNAGEFNGALQIQNTRVKKAPALADLISAISVIGLLEQLGGSGITFNTVEASFLLSPRGVTLRNSSAVGPSMGITMEGIFDTTTRRMNMQGVVSPIYFVNGIFGGVLARKKEGLFGFNYTLRGAADEPQVGVNPLSVLTPGIFREIFRQPPPQL